MEILATLGLITLGIILLGIIRIVFTPYTGFLNLLKDLIFFDSLGWIFDSLGWIIEHICKIWNHD
jgi:hypothetical protein